MERLNAWVFRVRVDRSNKLKVLAGIISWIDSLPVLGLIKLFFCFVSLFGILFEMPSSFSLLCISPVSCQQFAILTTVNSLSNTN